MLSIKDVLSCVVCDCVTHVSPAGLVTVTCMYGGEPAHWSDAKLTDAVLSQVMQMGPRVCSITAHRYGPVFKEAVYSVPFPWESLVIDTPSTTSLAGLLRMPRRAGAAGLRTIHTQELQISANLRQVSMVAKHAMCAFAVCSVTTCVTSLTLRYQLT